MCGHYRQTEIGLIKAKKILVRSVSPCVLCAGTGSISRGKLAAPQFCILHVRSPNIVGFGSKSHGRGQHAAEEFNIGAECDNEDGL